ncbi:MAG TPA: ATP-binding protein [Terracidiphilus sp.]|nr:ATP-binding protein [Terracidiphilus sp.]
MRQIEVTTGLGDAERKRVEAVVETLANLGSRGESVAEVAHDARNMVTALGLYCDLLEETGVLASPFAHYGTELRLVAAASRRLVEKLVALDGGRDKNPVTRQSKGIAGWVAERSAHGAIELSGLDRAVEAGGHRSLVELGPTEGRGRETPGRWDLMPTVPIEDLAAELLANQNLLAALAGPTILLTVDVEGATQPVRLTGEDLTRVMVNMVKNAAEAMPVGGRIHIELHDLPASEGTGDAVALTIEDNGPGIPETALEEIFTSGYTSRTQGAEARGSWPVVHRGLGLAISRSIVEAAGGRIEASNRAPAGARFEIDLPVRRR